MGFCGGMATIELPMRQHLFFVVRAIVVGLAAAFIIVAIWPELLTDNKSAVEIHQTARAPSERAPVVTSYASAVEKSAPAVVNINTAKLVTIRPHPFFSDPFFRRFFGRDGDELITPERRVESSLGSGVIVSTQGYIITNHHVISGADAIQISLRDGRMAPARVVGSDPETDIAVLKIDLAKLPSIALAQSDRVRVGDVVLAIGNPFGVGQTVTMGIVSATGRNKLGINTFENFIQTDAAINPGNSGGALIDANGDLVGINTAIFSRTGGSLGIGFAIPASLARGIFEDIVERGHPVRGWLGIEADNITPYVARTLDLKEQMGVVVTGVMRNGPAHKAGIEPGDVILAIDGKPIKEARDALVIISAHKPGSSVRLRIVRGGNEIMLKATAIERPQRTAENR
jgi:Do/DeqQ family serine protease